MVKKDNKGCRHDKNFYRTAWLKAYKAICEIEKIIRNYREDAKNTAEDAKKPA